MSLRYLGKEERGGVAWIAGLIAALSLPVIAYFLLRLPVLAFDNFADSTFYLAYSRNFSELVLRHGFLYYATRFGVILPDALTFWAFGEVAGVVVLRWGLLLGSCAALYSLFAKKGGEVAGCLVVVAWVFHPAVSRLLVTTYLDTVAVPFLLLGVCLWARGEVRPWQAFCIGCFLALAVTSHLYLIVMGVLLVPFLVGARWEKAKEFFCEVPWVFAGAVFVFGSALAYYGFVWKMPDLWSPTIELMRGMAAGDAQKWQRPLSDVLKDTPAWFSPFLLLAVLSVGFLRGNALWRGAFFSLLGASSFFWLGDLVGGAYALSMPFYYSFLLPAQILAMGSIVVWLLAGDRERWKSIFLVFSIAAACVFPAWVAAMEARPVDGVVGWCIAGGIAGIVWGVVRPGWLPVVAVFSLCSVQNFGVSTPGFSQFLSCYRRERPREERLLEVAARLRDVLPGAKESGKVTRFWTGKETEQDVRLLQWFFLYQFSNFQGGGNAAASYPKLDAGDVDAMRAEGIERVVVLDKKEETMREALRSLEKAGFAEMQSGSVRFRSTEVYYGYAEKGCEDFFGAQELPLDGWKPSFGAAVSRTGDGLRVRTGEKKWMADAESKIPKREGEENIRKVVFFGKVKEGRVTLSVLSETGQILASSEWWQTEGEVPRVFEVPEGSAPASLVLRNMQPDGSRSEVFFRQIQVVR